MREVSCDLEVAVRTSAYLVLAIAPHSAYALSEEKLDVQLDGQPLTVTEERDAYGNRRHTLTAEPGTLRVTYRATVGDATSSEPSPPEVLEFLRPSRYCDSDRLAGVAHSLFSADAPADQLVEQIRQWALQNIMYAPGSTDYLDGATEVYLSRRGVCRDTAHLITAFARALGLPARVTAVYAPRLSPMDFHAVAEVLIDGQWRVVDGTGLAPRSTMVRIVTGRDAADTAFLDSITGQIEIITMQVDAQAPDGVSDDDGASPVALR